MKYCLSVLAVLMMLVGQAQTEDNPVVWEHEVIPVDSVTYELVFKGTILQDWHVYSQFTPEGGSQPSELVFEGAGQQYELLGKASESKTYREYSDVFGVDEVFFKKQAIFTQRIKLLQPIDQVKVLLYYQVCKEVCIPKEELFTISLSGKEVALEEVTLDARSKALGDALLLDLKHKERLQEGDDTVVTDQTSFWTIFGLGFLGGLIALLTPCVFPMIPLTVSFFTKQSANRGKGIAQAVLYGAFIVLIYALLSLPFHLFNTVDSQILNTIATNIWLNLFFFVIFVVFAFSFFGYFELRLPTSWANKMDSASTRIGGVLGIFFMALTLAIVSFSCTGPILGGLLGSTTLANGDVATNLSIGMIGFGVALALPFALFAMFPAWLNALPKSGGWMATVKVVLGFLELALAFKFLSNADLVAHWGLLKREVFLGIWILIFLLMAAYLFGWFRFPHDPPKSKKSLPRIVLGMLSLLFVGYLTFGLVQKTPLKALSGFPPPDFYSLRAQQGDCPLGLDCYKDFEKGLAYAKAQNKPILLDFTGWACVNCRKMEENVWSEPAVYNTLKQEYVLISLYIDDREELPQTEQFDFLYNKGHLKEITTVGDKWGTFQTLNFNAASQPYYVLLSPDLEVLHKAVQYTDTDTFQTWLQEGVQRFKSK